MEEKTLIFIKPDGMEKRLVGEIFKRFEQSGLKIVACKMVRAPKELLGKHYPDTDEWYQSVGRKTLKSYEEYKMDPVKEIGTKDEGEIGRMVKKWTIDYVAKNPIIIFVLKGNRAVDNARRLAGATLPIFANPGTIRGDYSCESADRSNAEKRAVENLIHASGTPEEAEFEINLWFRKEEIFE